jgi:type II secretory pathway component GspD/PulD (secretin)
MLMLRATIEELDIVEKTLHGLHALPPQVALDVKFCEITEEVSKRLGFEWMLDGIARRQEAFPLQQPENGGTDDLWSR